MSNPNFIDYVKIFCKSGNGGAGSVHFRREKHAPKGGPDGGDGGRGGHVILKGNAKLWTLLHLKYTKHIIAENGTSGSGARMTGPDAEDRYIEVPIGTVAKDAETGEVICEITKHDEQIILMQGGKGGLGNNNFKTSTNQTPMYAQPGIPCQEAWVVLELKLLADVGLVGFPNAGKSTLLSVVSAARPEIADYPFTTLTPNLGVVRYRDGLSFVMADIPGIIEGASEGKGLGIRFLRHIERNALLLFMIPADAPDIARDYKILLAELKKYNPELLNKQKILAITKADMLDESYIAEMRKTLPKGITALFISSLTGYNIEKLKDMLWKKLHE
ncbi:MAG: GTPase ObgE [Cytophagales bacterium]|nr:GTPase ObgE [Cytophagales bacterium]